MTQDSSASAHESSLERFETSVIPGQRARPSSVRPLSLSAGWLLLLAIAALSMSIRSAWGAGTSEVAVTVKDADGKIVPGVEIALTALDTGEKSLGTAPWTMKTNKKGVAFFPFLTWNSQGN